MPSNKSVLLFYQINHFKIYSKDFDYLIQANNDISKNTERVVAFKASPILSKQNLELLTAISDEKAIPLTDFLKFIYDEPKVSIPLQK